MPQITPRGQHNNPFVVQSATTQLCPATGQTTVSFTSIGWQAFADIVWIGLVAIGQTTDNGGGWVATTLDINERRTTQFVLSHTSVIAADVSNPPWFDIIAVGHM